MDGTPFRRRSTAVRTCDSARIGWKCLELMPRTSEALLAATIRPRGEARAKRARYRRAGDLREAPGRPLGRARLLDRRRLARRAAGAGGRLPLHRAPALQGLVPLQRAGDRGA